MVDAVRTTLYVLLNIATASGIVFANKLVLSTLGWHFTYALTLLHTLTTLLGMKAFQGLGMFEKKILPTRKILPLAAAYVAYIVLCNLNLQLNTVGFYQISKIAVAPTVLVLEFLMFNKRASRSVVASIAVVCLGVGLSTVTDFQLGVSILGLVVGAGAVGATSLYQIWAGSRQKELGAGSMQMLDQYCPLAAGMLVALVGIVEPVGWVDRNPETILGYHYTSFVAAAIALSSVLGLLVSLSTFLVIGATSSLTYNVVGHIKTVIILAGGCLLFGEEMPSQKLAGIGLAMVGIVWYSHLKLQQSSQAAKEDPDSSGNHVISLVASPDKYAPLASNSPKGLQTRSPSNNTMVKLV